MRSEWNSDVLRWVPSMERDPRPKTCSSEHYCDVAAAELQDEPVGNTC